MASCVCGWLCVCVCVQSHFFFSVLAEGCRARRGSALPRAGVSAAGVRARGAPETTQRGSNLSENEAPCVPPFNHSCADLLRLRWPGPLVRPRLQFPSFSGRWRSRRCVSVRPGPVRRVRGGQRGEGPPLLTEGGQAENH